MFFHKVHIHTLNTLIESCNGFWRTVVRWNVLSATLNARYFINWPPALYGLQIPVSIFFFCFLSFFLFSYFEDPWLPLLITRSSIYTQRLNLTFVLRYFESSEFFFFFFTYFLLLWYSLHSWMHSISEAWNFIKMRNEIALLTDRCLLSISPCFLNEKIGNIDK